MSNHAENEAKRRKATRPRKEEALPSTSSSTRKASPRKRNVPQMCIRGGIVPHGTHPSNETHPCYLAVPGVIDERRILRSIGELVVALSEADPTGQQTKDCIDFLHDKQNQS